MSDTRKQTAFRLPKRLLALVDRAVEDGRAENRTAAVEQALRRWLGEVPEGDVSPLVVGPIPGPPSGGFMVPESPRPLRPRKEHVTGWMGARQHLPQCKCSMCKPPKEAA